MLIGRPPFTHNALGDLIVAHMTEPVRDVRELNPAVPPPLADLVGELLRKDPATRPAGMRAVADRLAGFMGGLTTVPEPPLAPAPAPIPKQPSKTTFGDAASEIVDEDLDKIPRRRRPLALTVVAAMVIGLGVGGVFARRGHAPAARTPLPATWSTKAAPPATAVASPTGPAHATDEKEPHGRHAAKKEAAGKHGRHTLAATTPADTGEAATHAATEPPPAAQSSAAPFDYSGTWEGPWNDPDRGQQGRLYLRVGPGPTASGWFSNSGVGESFQVVGQAESPGVFSLTCVCPVGQAFTLRATLHDRDGADLRGRLTLASTTGVFGQSHVVLRRAPSK
jgi:serine/threonine-protein kinase